MLKSVNEILDFAIRQEELAAEFYTGMAEKMSNEHMKEAFMSFAKEEWQHKAKLTQVKNGKKMLSAESKVADLKISDYLQNKTELSKDADYGQALLLAMQAEKEAYRLYTSLALATDDPEIKQLLTGLANEEANHKLRFEIEYDQEFLREN